jgi:hypothetical protein
MPRRRGPRLAGAGAAPRPRVRRSAAFAPPASALTLRSAARSWHSNAQIPRAFRRPAPPNTQQPLRGVVQFRRGLRQFSDGHLQNPSGDPIQPPRKKVVDNRGACCPVLKGRTHRSGPAPLASRDPAESLGTAWGSSARQRVGPKREPGMADEPAVTPAGLHHGREVASPALAA